MEVVASDPSSSSSSSSPPLIWAMDSRNGELDMDLRAAKRQAEQEYLDGAADQAGGPLEKPIILRNLLSEEQIVEILGQVSADGVWPRGLYEDENRMQNYQSFEPPQDFFSSTTPTSKNSTIGKSTVSEAELHNELRLVPHHFAWTEGHVVLYMHNNNHWFVRTLSEAWGVIRGGMEARAWMNDAVPVLDMDFIGAGAEEDPSMDLVRTVELHHYGPGGGLTTPGHRDCGSELTMSVLLSDSELVLGGDFVTYDKGVPIAHQMNRGDAILFNAMSLHNIATITSGIRKSLVVELWPSSF